MGEILKENATLKHIVLQSKGLYKPRILVQIWSEYWWRIKKVMDNGMF